MKKCILVFFAAAQAKVQRQVHVGGFIQRTQNKVIEYPEDERVFASEEERSVLMKDSEMLQETLNQRLGTVMEDKYCEAVKLSTYLPYDAREQYKIYRAVKGASLKDFGMKEGDDKSIYKAVLWFGTEIFPRSNIECINPDGPIAKALNEVDKSSSALYEKSKAQWNIAGSQLKEKEGLMKAYHTRILEATERMSIREKAIWTGGGAVNASLTAPVNDVISLTGGLLCLAGMSARIKFYGNINAYAGIKYEKTSITAYAGAERNGSENLKNSFVYGVFVGLEYKAWQISAKIGCKKGYKGVDAALIIAKNILG